MDKNDESEIIKTLDRLKFFANKSTPTQYISFNPGINSAKVLGQIDGRKEETKVLPRVLWWILKVRKERFLSVGKIELIQKKHH